MTQDQVADDPDAPTTGVNPWLAEMPKPPRQELKPKITESVTLDLEKSLMDRIKAVVAVAFTGEPVQGLKSVTKFFEAAGRRKIAALRVTHNRGEKWPSVRQLPRGPRRGGRRRSSEEIAEDEPPVRSTPPLTRELMDEVRGFVYTTAIEREEPVEDIRSQREFFAAAAGDYIDELERTENGGQPWSVPSGPVPRGARRS